MNRINKIAADPAWIVTRQDVRKKVLSSGGLEPLLQMPNQLTEIVLEDRLRYSQPIRLFKLSLARR